MEEYIKDLETSHDTFILTVDANISYFLQQNDYAQKAGSGYRMDMFTT